MTEETVYIAFPKQLYIDIVRFSDGKISPEILVENQVQQWMEGSVEFSDTWGERAYEVAEKYAPDVFQRWLDEDDEASDSARSENRPLIWKEISITAGSEVRMSYSGHMHIAKIKRGKIVDEDGDFSPSEWASKVAERTSRNAWRDLWFREAKSTNWVSAQTLRDQAKSARG